MTVYIKREDAIDTVLDVYYNTPDIDLSGERLEAAILNIPAADVAAVQHGRWTFGKDLPDSFGSMNKNKYHLYCSECRHQAFNKSADNDCDFDEDTPFCPWCGSKMVEEEVRENIKDAPTAAVVEVRHGKWIQPHWKNSNYCCNCSECGREAMHREYQWDKNGIYPICPNCGAKMDKE